MAIEISFDLYGGEAQIGVGPQTNRYNRVIRRGFARGIPTTNNGLFDAIDKAATDAFNAYPNPYGVPLAYIRATRFGPTTAFLTLVYQPVPLGGGGGNTGFVNASTRSSYRMGRSLRRSTSFSPQGWPNGELRGDNGEPFDPSIVAAGQANPIYDPAGAEHLWNAGVDWRVPSDDIAVPFILNANPYAAVMPLKGYVNSDTFVICGYQFKPGSVRFDGMSVDSVGNSAAPTFRGHYLFHAEPSGLGEEVLWWDVNASPRRWITVFAAQNPSTNFSNKFPYQPFPPSI